MQKDEILQNLVFEAYYASELEWLMLKPSNDGKKGQVFFCPFHNDTTTPSLSIDFTTGYFNCFGCGKKGSVFVFIWRGMVYVGFSNIVKPLSGQTENRLNEIWKVGQEGRRILEELEKALNK
jgi:DNA primase